METMVVGYFCVFISWCVSLARNHYTASQVPNLYNSVILNKQAKRSYRRKETVQVPRHDDLLRHTWKVM